LSEANIITPIDKNKYQLYSFVATSNAAERIATLRLKSPFGKFGAPFGFAHGKKCYAKFYQRIKS
jgi:hypothetical protein